MLETTSETTCKACGRPIVQRRGHRKRAFCNATCRQRQHRLATEQKAREQQQAALQARLGDTLPETLRVLGEELQLYSSEFANRLVAALCADLDQMNDVAQARMDALKAENAALKAAGRALQERLTAIQEVEERFRNDTQERAFKSWLAKQARSYAETPFGRRFLDREAGIPPRGSLARYRQLLKNAGYSKEDMETFHEAWKSMLLAQS